MKIVSLVAFTSCWALGEFFFFSAQTLEKVLKVAVEGGGNAKGLAGDVGDQRVAGHRSLAL